MTTFNIGSLVRTRGREWVVLPSPDRDLVLLRPLGGGESEICGIYRPLKLDPIEAAVFPDPDPSKAADHLSGTLLRDAARLSSRSGAGPFRSMGRLSLRPRPYQIVPLLMALRLDPVRMLVADDVGIGKTIEAALIARELLDRGEIKRLAVICPPYLCDQWQKELSEKFHIEAVVVRSSTIARLERQVLYRDVSIYAHFPHLVISVDYVKSDRHRHAFLSQCPEMVIVDEAHGCARPAGQNALQQQRHELITDLARKQDRHLILLTATPHSGVEESFTSLLGLIRPEFAKLRMTSLREESRIELARHFVQRRRIDVQDWLGEETHFPRRTPIEVPYSLSPQYKDLFKSIYAFAQELVSSGEALAGWRQRIRYWTALALLRCVMSSPKAAEAALAARAKESREDREILADADMSPYIYDPTEREATVDQAPAHVVEEGEAEVPEQERRRLRTFAKQASSLSGAGDQKLQELLKIVTNLLDNGFHPIVWCRYIHTSDYVAQELKQKLGTKWRDLAVLSVTGTLSDEERKVRVEELSQSPRRILVATDCLSEGINLQESFTAVVHYDLPWNPNRLEQREGRVDRFGQRVAEVKAVLLYGADNPVDLAVLDVLIRKAIDIRRDLGISVPVPVESETVMEAVLQSLFLRAKPVPRYEQLTFFQEEPAVKDVHYAWDLAREREKENRTRFAQRAIHPDEVENELREADAALGDPKAVERFVLTACERLGAPLQHKKGYWLLHPAPLPSSVKETLGAGTEYRIAFRVPVPERVQYIGRNHPFTTALCDFLLGEVLDPTSPEHRASRSGVIRTDAVSKKTTLLLLRIRHLLSEADQGLSMLSEETWISGFTGRSDEPDWLPDAEAIDFLERALPTARVSSDERLRSLTETIQALKHLEPHLEKIAYDRAKHLSQAHRRVRRITRESRLTVTPHLPPDILGVYLLLPVPKGVIR